MEKIESRVQPRSLLHFIIRRDDFLPGRHDLIQPEHFLQCSMLNLENKTTFKPHKHIFHEGTKEVIAQESWVVIKGIVKVIFYDLDNSILAERWLYAGDASFTLGGGHNYEIMESDTRVLEFKTGPYLGQEKDKVFI